MKLALIPPLSRISDVYNQDYHLVLPQLLTVAAYSHVYAECRRRGDFVILDNGANENNLARWDLLLHMAQQLQPSEVVLPDVMGDGEATFKLLGKLWPTRNEGFNYMYVAQAPSGYTSSNVAIVATAMSAARAIDLGVQTLGLPRNLIDCCGRYDARIQVAEILLLERDRGEYNYDIHFLGTNPKWIQEIKYAQQVLGDQIRGCDTGAPYYYALNGHSVASDEEMHRPDRYFETAIFRRTEDLMVLDYNIDRMKRWANGTS